MNAQHGNTNPQAQAHHPVKHFASRLLTAFLAASLAVGPLSAASTVWASTASTAAPSVVPFKVQQTQPTVLAPKSAVTYSTLKPSAYKNKPAVALNNNKPKFTVAQLKSTKEYEKYSNLDKYGRAQTAIACIGKKLMPTSPRGSIGTVKPAGFKTTKYDFIDGKYLYNRCHLIAYELAGENANKKNLTTGTRYLNVKGMLPYENKVAAYVKKTGKHVLYRVTPVYNGTELIPRGVTIEAKSIEDKGKGICFYVYCYNVQPGVKINYKTGASSADGTVTASKAGWKKVNGKWYYYKSDGKTVVKSSWLKLNGKVYYVNKDGVRLTGFHTIGGKKYWFDGSGVMATGWKTIDGKKYWFDSKGVMATGTRTIGGKSYTFGSDGALKSGSSGSGGSGTNVTASYIGNKNTKKFHKSTCSSVSKMSDSNKVGFNSRSAAVNAGYTPCKNCNP